MRSANRALHCHRVRIEAHCARESGQKEQKGIGRTAAGALFSRMDSRRENTVATEETQCAVCGGEIPAARLKAMPETMVCIECSQNIGGEYELEVKVSSTGKAGSLKKTGEAIEVRRKRKF